MVFNEKLEWMEENSFKYFNMINLGNMMNCAAEFNTNSDQL